MSPKPTPTILILMSDTGGGHRSAAEALRDAVHHCFDHRYHVVLEDLFKQGRWPAPLLPRLYPPWINRMAWSWGAAFHSSNGRKRATVTNRMMGASIGRPVQRLFEQHNPALVVSVHPMMNAVPERVLRRFNPRTPFVTVVTDLFSAHALWFHPPVDLLLVPTEGAAHRARRHRVAAEKTHVVGQPISLQYAANHRLLVEQSANGNEVGGFRAAQKVELGLRPEPPLALLVGGGDGMGRLYDIARTIDEAGLPLQLAVVAGRNEALRERLEAVDWQIPVQVHGFVTHMPALMRAADLIVTKAGPGTIMEAAASGLPILLYGFLPGQERGNVDFVLQHGLGALRQSPAAIVAELARWLDPGSPRLAEMRERAKAVARPEAALDAANLLDALVQTGRPGAPRPVAPAAAAPLAL